MNANETIKKAKELIAKSNLNETDKPMMAMALDFHGHVCPAMPAAFRAGSLALNKLGMDRERNSVSRVYAETGSNHAAGCVVDGMQAATGCTFGKGNIVKLNYGKWAFTLMDKDKRAVRVAIKTEVMEKNFTSPFIEARKKGILPSQVDPQFALKIFEATLEKPENEFFDVSDIFNYENEEKKIETCFYSVRCQKCGELVTENYIRYKRGKLLCIPCSGYDI